MDEKVKVILVGRHSAAEIPGLEVVETNNISWPATSSECTEVLGMLLANAKELGAHVVLQAVPAQLAACVAAIAERDAYSGDVRVWAIVSKPGARETGVPERWSFNDGQDSEIAAKLAAKMNPNAKIEWIDGVTFNLTVDAPMRFEFSHLEVLL